MITDRVLNCFEKSNLIWFNKPGMKGGSPKRHFIDIAKKDSPIVNCLVIRPGFNCYYYNWN